MPGKVIASKPRKPCSTKPKRLQYLQIDPEPTMPKTRKTGMAMSIEQMADELAIGRNVAYQLIKQPGFPAFMIGRRVLVSRKGLQTWIDEQCRKGAFVPDHDGPQIHETIEK